jgi:hypothetical protein
MAFVLAALHCWLLVAPSAALCWQHIDPQKHHLEHMCMTYLDLHNAVLHTVAVASCSSTTPARFSS